MQEGGTQLSLKMHICLPKSRMENKDLSLIVKEYLLETSRYQIVKESTKAGDVAGNEVSRV